MKEEEEATKKILMLLKYLEHQMRLLKEVEVVAMAVATQKEFLVSYVSFFSSGELHLDLIVVAKVVDIDVGSGEPDCDDVRSITGVVIEGTEEVS
nr:hypothetical protein [Tanacetum cinerariifolium]